MEALWLSLSLLFGTSLAFSLGVIFWLSSLRRSSKRSAPSSPDSRDSCEGCRRLESRMDDLEAGWVSQKTAIRSLLGRLDQRLRREQEKNGGGPDDVDGAPPQGPPTLAECVRKGLVRL